MPIPYEILIRGENGSFKGAHVVDVPGGVARVVLAADWPTLAKDFNAALLATVADKDAALTAKDAVLAAKSEELTSLQSVVSEATKVVLDPDISDEDTVLLLKQKIEAQSLPGMIAQAQEQRDAWQAKLDALQKK